MRVLCLWVLTFPGCGILAPGNDVSFEWSHLSLESAAEVVEFDRASESFVLTGTFALFSGCYDLELDHEVLEGMLELRLTQHKARSGCPEVEVMAEYTITVSDLAIAESFAVIHDYGSSLERVLLEGVF